MTELSELTEEVVRFRDERDWAQFHTPRNLAAALAIEAAELQEAMLWKTDPEVDEFARDEGRTAISHELADVLIYTLLLCHRLGIDPLRAVEDKLEENRHKYPVHLAKGNAAKYDRLR